MKVNHQISRLTLGGGGLGNVWGKTTREDAIKTVLAAVDSGINLLDMAPMYGRKREAEHVVGETFKGKKPEHVKVLTKCFVGNKEANEIEGQLRHSLKKSLNAMQIQFVDFFILHSNIVPDEWINPMKGEADVCTRWSAYIDGFIPAVEKLKAEGLIKNWGITGVGEPLTIIKALKYHKKPKCVEVIANCMDLLGGMKRFYGPAMPREIMKVAHDNDVLVFGIRAVAAGSLCDTIDRDVPIDSPTQIDYFKATKIREYAKKKGVSTAYLMHRYAISMPYVTTIILGVKNLDELNECLLAEKHGKLTEIEMNEIDQLSQFARL